MTEKATLTTTIEGYDAERVERMLVEHLAQRFEEETLKDIQKEARGRAQARIAEVAKETIDAEVRDLLTNGWETTNTWGEKTGERFTLRGYLVNYLKASTGDRWGENKKTPVQHAITEAVAAVFTKDFEAEIDAARRSLREQLDAVIKGKFVAIMKQALGI